jgi:hypothetical protein
MRSATKGVFIIVSLFLFLSGCRLQRVKHNPVKAAFDANRFLKSFYFDEDYNQALRLAGEDLQVSTTPDDFKEMLDGIKRQKGGLKILKADSYLMTPGATMELFYTGEYERGALYHRLVVVGDAASGYRVTGVWFQTEPYSESQFRRKFDLNILVK